MINTNTVLVLGAGASIPFGFPSGIKLKDKICGFVVGRREYNFLKDSYTEAEIQKFMHEMVRSPDYSVDQFLEHRPEYLEIGKRSIALALLPHERTVRLFEDWAALRSGSVTELGSEDGNNWYQYLFSRLMTTFDKFGDNSLSVITFNYDRSLEHYLFTSLKNKYSNKTDSECAAQLDKIPIIHVHGKLGQLPWEQSGISVVPYDASAEPGRTGRQYACQAASHIKIIHEKDVADAFGGAHDLLRNATRIYFLGFGFNKTNVLRLLPEDVRKKNNMRGTCLGISPHVRRELLQTNMPTMGGGCFEPMTIYQFLFNDPDAILD